MSVIKLEKSGPIATLTLTRPEMMNALGQEGDDIRGDIDGTMQVIMDTQRLRPMD